MFQIHREVFSWLATAARRPEKKMPDTHTAMDQKTLHIIHGAFQTPEPSGHALAPTCFIVKFLFMACDCRTQAWKKRPDTHTALDQKTLHIHHRAIQRPEPLGHALAPTPHIENSATAHKEIRAPGKKTH